MGLIKSVKKLFGQYPKFDPNMVLDFAESNKFTPDVPFLEILDCVKIFVCDEMLKGCDEHKRLGENIRAVDTAYTVDPFVLWKKPLGKASYAIPLAAKEHYKDRLWAQPRGMATNIRGSIHLISPVQVMDVLDKHYQNGVEFTRTRVEVFYPYKERTEGEDHGKAVDVFSKEKIATTMCWMYVGKPEFWNQIEANKLKLVRTYAPNDKSKPPYYLFTSSEYNVD